jgi:hypothetical protein
MNQVNGAEENPDEKVADARAIFVGSLKARIDEANKNITHAEFVTGMRNQTIGYTVMVGEPFQMLSRGRKIIFNFFVMLYLVGPFIIVPVWAYLERNWWLLLGIVVSVIATRVAAWQIYFPQRKNSIGGFLLFASIASWFFDGIHNYWTFFLLSALWGFVLFIIADNTERKYATETLVENSELFDNAIAQRRIMIVRPGHET